MKFSLKRSLFTENIDLFVAGGALCILVLSTFLGVIMRYFVNKPFPWIEEMQMWMIVWLVCIGGGAAFRHNAHISLDFLVDLFPQKGKDIFRIFGIAVAVCIYIFMTYHGLMLVLQMVIYHRTTNILHIPLSIIYSAFPIGILLMAINNVFQFITPRFDLTQTPAGENK